MPRLLILAVLLLLPSAIPCVFSSSAAAESYQDFALRLVRKPPKGARFRPDLESYLDKLATTARRKKGRRGVASNGLLLPAARAQAVEMLTGDFVGHRSKSGYRFGARFEAFAGEERGRHGENAARDRQPGPVDRTKARRLFQQWLDSTGHRRNLMHRDYKYVSTGVIERGNHLYAVQIYWER
ncbi:MAG: CAP domain-containing protein [Hyphomicrobiales bacterium]